MQTSICTTNYNCAHALERHLQSVFSQLSGLEFEYIVVDNHSRDGSWEILRKWASRQPAMRVLSRRSTMGDDAVVPCVRRREPQGGVRLRDGGLHVQAILPRRANDPAPQEGMGPVQDTRPRAS